MTKTNKTTTAGLVIQADRKPPMSKTSGSRESASLMPHWGGSEHHSCCGLGLQQLPRGEQGPLII